MSPIPPKIRTELSRDTWYDMCIHQRYRGRIGSGNLQWEHAYLYRGKQIQEKWAIVPCRKSFNMDATGSVKRFNQYIALLRATNEELDKYQKKDWAQLKIKFIEEFGIIEI